MTTRLLRRRVWGAITIRCGLKQGQSLLSTVYGPGQATYGALTLGVTYKLQCAPAIHRRHAIQA